MTNGGGHPPQETNQSGTQQEKPKPDEKKEPVNK